MSDSAFPARSTAVSHRRRRSLRTDASTLHHVRRAVILPVLLLAALLGVAFAVWSMGALPPGWLLVGLLGGVVGVALVTARGVHIAADAAETAAEERRAAVLAAVTGASAAVEKSVVWSADELCRGHDRRCQMWRPCHRPVRTPRSTPCWVGSRRTSLPR